MPFRHPVSTPVHLCPLQSHSNKGDNKGDRAGGHSNRFVFLNTHHPVEFFQTSVIVPCRVGITPSP